MTGEAPRPGAKKYSECAIRLCGSELIEKQLLIALGDESKVACIFEKADVNAILFALRAVAKPSQKHKELEHDLRQLYVAAFGEPVQC